MDNMICYSCVLKHLSTALSFGKEILSGHTKGDELDHRIDFIGEICNAEQHLELIDKALFADISAYRKEVQEKDVLIDNSDLEYIRQMYLKVEALKDGNSNGDTESPELEADPDIVYLAVTNKAYFDMSYKMLKAKISDYKQIYVLKSDIPLTDYSDVTVLDKTLKEFVESAENNFILTYENTGFLKPISARKIPVSYSMQMKDIVKDMGYFRKKGITSKIYCYDRLKASTVYKDKMKEVLTDYTGDNYMTAYAYLSEQTSILNDIYVTVNVDRVVCCSMKTSLKQKMFVRWNENGFESLKSFLNY